MIKGIILDVDGVMIGSKKGYNWPQPHVEVIKTLKNLRKKGIVVSLCSGKGTFALRKIVEDAYLNNLHIGDGGAVVTDFLDNIIIEKHIIEKESALSITKTFLEQNIILELYTVENYYVQQNQMSDLTKKHTAILYRKPKIVESLIKTAQKLEIVKIMPIAKNDEDKNKINTIFNEFKFKFQ